MEGLKKEFFHNNPKPPLENSSNFLKEFFETFP